MLLEDSVSIKNKILSMPLAQQASAIAQWAIGHLEAYKQKQYPDKPKEVNDYFLSPIDMRRKMNKRPFDFADFWNSEEVKQYFDAVQKIKNENQRNREFLLWMRKIIPDEEIINDALKTHAKLANDVAQPAW